MTDRLGDQYEDDDDDDVGMAAAAAVLATIAGCLVGLLIALWLLGGSW